MSMQNTLKMRLVLMTNVKKIWLFQTISKDKERPFLAKFWQNRHLNQKNLSSWKPERSNKLLVLFGFLLVGREGIEPSTY